jgi:hypothetical protein
MPTFRETAMMVHGEHSPSWKNKKHAAQWLSSLEAYAFPKLGNLPVNQIDGPMLRDILAEIWLVIPETARRVRQRIGTVRYHGVSPSSQRRNNTTLQCLGRRLPHSLRISLTH